MEKAKRHEVPIMDFDLDVILTDSIRKSYDKRHTVPLEEEEYYAGLFAYSNRTGTLFFDKRHLTHNLIAHEVRHAVDRMMEFNNQRFGNGKCIETPAMVQGYLADLVYKDLKRWKAKIK